MGNMTEGVGSVHVFYIPFTWVGCFYCDVVQLSKHTILSVKKAAQGAQGGEENRSDVTLFSLADINVIAGIELSSSLLRLSIRC